jgi:hypothetical protein
MEIAIIIISLLILLVIFNELPNLVEPLDKGKLDRVSYSRVPQTKTKSDDVEVETQRYKVGHSLFEIIPPSVKKDHRWPTDNDFKKTQDFLEVAGLRPTKETFKNNKGTVFPKYSRGPDGTFRKIPGAYGSTLQARPDLKQKYAAFMAKEKFEEYPNVLEDPRYDPSGGFELAKQFYYVDANQQPLYSLAPIKNIESSPQPRGAGVERFPPPWQFGRQTAMSATVEPINDYTDYKNLPDPTIEMLDEGGKIMTPMNDVKIELDPMLKNIPQNHPTMLTMKHNDAARMKNRIYGRQNLRDTLVQDVLTFRTPAKWAPG